MRRSKILTVSSMTVALSVVLTRFASVRLSFAGVEGVRIGLGSMPTIILGMSFGPIYGAIAGALADIVGFLLSPMGVYMPHFTLTAALTGALPGLFLRALGGAGQEDKVSWLRIGAALSLSTVLVSWGLTPYFLQKLFGLDFRLLLPARMLASLFEVPIYTISLKTLYTPMRRLLISTSSKKI